MDEEIKAKKEAIRARCRAGLKNWRIWGVLAGGYIALFALPYFVFRGAHLVMKGFQDVDRFFPNLAFDLAYFTANIALGVWIVTLVALYILCPVTGAFTMKLRPPKDGRSAAS